MPGEARLARDKADLERLVAERSEELARRERLQHTLLETVDQAIVAADVHGRIQAFNHAAEQLFGYRAEEVIGRLLTLLMEPETAKGHQRVMERYLETGEARLVGRGAREVTAP